MAQMTRKHFELIAEAIRTAPDSESYPLGPCATRRSLAEHFADKLQHTNLNFDRARFIQAATRSR